MPLRERFSGLITGHAIKLLDVVALTEDLAEYGLLRGQVGTVVLIHEPGVFEVEFVNEDGSTYDMLPLNQDQLLLLHYHPIKAASA